LSVSTPRRLYVTSFIGAPDVNIPKDTEAAELWQELFKQKGADASTADLGSEANGYQRGMKPERAYILLR